MLKFFVIIYKVIKGFFVFILETIKAIFLTGFLTLLPITLTVALFAFSWRVIQGWLEPLNRIRPAIFEQIPHAELILVLLFIFITGTILKLFVMRSAINILESILEKIPLVRSVYGGIKRIVNAFGTQDKESFRQVVLVEYPRNGVYCIGFLTSEFPQELSPDTKQEFSHVYIPTTPNPTTGYLAIIPAEQITKISLSRQEAMALIISGGIIKPTRFKRKRKSK
jgi:uncharacterized membrane protein